MKENYKFAETDYKAGSEDVLYALQETFRDEVPELDSDVMISLAENYSMEQTLDVIKAMERDAGSSASAMSSARPLRANQTSCSTPRPGLRSAWPPRRPCAAR